MKLVSQFFLILLFFCSSCTQDETPTNPPIIDDVFILLPEGLIALNAAANMSAFYSDPTMRYPHGALGDQTEAGGIVVGINGTRYYHQLTEDFVFEDLRPRLFDVDQDGLLEIITIRTSLTQGASVAVYKIIDEELVLLASSNFIGTANRWLNIAAIDDLNNDGQVEIAWVQTPHIGGILRVFTFEGGELVFLDEKSGVSNHALNSRNLCLSVLSESSYGKRLYVPNNGFNEVVGFELINDELIEVDRISQDVDADQRLNEQIFIDDLADQTNCINVE